MYTSQKVHRGILLTLKTSTGKDLLIIVTSNLLVVHHSRAEDKS